MVVHITESNDAGPGVTEDVTCNYGVTDDPNLTPASDTIDAGNNSMEKYWQVEVDSVESDTQASRFRAWRNGALGHASTGHDGNLVDGTPPSDGYVQPVTTTSTVATVVMPTVCPQDPNLHDGALTAGGRTNFMVSQVQPNASDTGETENDMIFCFLVEQ